MVRTVKIPQYKMIYEVLRRQISEGVYNEGDLLSSENELCRLYGLTRPTIRQALGKLESDGFIVKHQGKGSIVNRPPLDIGILSVYGTTSAVGNRNLKTRIVVKPRLIKWPGEFMFPLSDVEMESGCIYFERLRLLDDVPIFYDISYLPNINLPRLTSRKFENRSLFRILRESYNIEIKGGEQRIRAITSSARIGKFLGMKKGDPLLHLERKIATNVNGLFLYSSIYCNTSRHSIFGRF